METRRRELRLNTGKMKWWSECRSPLHFGYLRYYFLAGSTGIAVADASEISPTVPAKLSDSSATERDTEWR